MARPAPLARRAALLVAVLSLGAAAGLGMGSFLRGGRIGAPPGSNPDSGPGFEASLVLPTGLRASVFARGLSGPRFMALAPDGAVLVAERGADRVIALRDTDGDGAADRVDLVGSGYGSAHSLALEADGSLLVAGETTLWRVRLGADRREVSREAVLGGLPTGGHGTRTVLVRPDGTILLSVGSSCDACLEDDPRRAAVLAVDPRTGDWRVLARGLRNAVGLVTDPATGDALADVMGRDRLGDDVPPETVHRLVEGLDGGWPRCHAGRIVDPDLGAAADPVSGRTGCDGVAAPLLELEAHAAPLGMAFWRGDLVIALHGSWNRTTRSGYRVVAVPWHDGAPAGPVTTLAGGFLPDPGAGAAGRPAGLLVAADGSLLVSDDKGGFIYRIGPA